MLARGPRKTRPWPPWWRGLPVAALWLVLGCQALEELPGRLLDRRPPRERYEAALAAAGLDGTALAAEWLAAGRRALESPAPIGTAHVEQGYLLPAEPVAIAFRVSARRGQVIRAQFSMPGDSTTRVFLDAWLVTGDTTAPRLVSSADSGARALEVDPRRDGDYILRIQPELLRGGRFAVEVRVAPTLAFPVVGGRESDVGSRWGADRDGGARSHQGIDIFARRGTPVLAAAPGVVRRVDETGLGGKVVWVTDDAGNRLYYAHLDTQAVSGGERVEVGDTLGTVGNTGNARTTPPHLHFGVYRRGEGAVDPWWFVHRPREALPRLAVDTTRLGNWIRTRAEGTPLRPEPDSRAAEGRPLPRFTAARVVAAVGDWYRVRLPDGAMGYVAASAAEAAESPLGLDRGTALAQLLATPVADPQVEVIVAPDLMATTLAVLGRFEGFFLVRTPAGNEGWIRTE